MSVSTAVDHFDNDDEDHDDNESVIEAIDRTVEILRRVDPQRRAYVLRAASHRLDEPEKQTAKTVVLGLLSRREREIFAFLVDGHNNREIAAALCISRKTVDTHRGHIFKKLKIHSVVALVLLAAREGILAFAVSRTALPSVSVS